MHSVLLKTGKPGDTSFWGAPEGNNSLKPSSWGPQVVVICLAQLKMKLFDDCILHKNQYHNLVYLV